MIVSNLMTIGKKCDLSWSVFKIAANGVMYAYIPVGSIFEDVYHGFFFLYSYPRLPSIFVAIFFFGKPKKYLSV